MIEKRKTNEEFVSELMAYNQHGGLAQIFIIEAIRYYAEQVASSKPNEDSKAMINPVAWHAVATEILEKMRLNYE